MAEFDQICASIIPVQIPGIIPGKPKQQVGRIHLYCGSMFSGKTTMMWENLQKARLAGRPVLIVKFAGDTRYTSDAAIETHSGLSFTSEPATEYLGQQIVVQSGSLFNVTIPAGIRDIGIDEGQFFGDLSDIVFSWTQIGGITVHIAALLADKDQRHFGCVLSPYKPGCIEEILPFCRIHQLYSVCRSCGDNAIHTVKIGGSDNLVEIGGIELYHPVCENCLSALRDTETRQNE